MCDSFRPKAGLLMIRGSVFIFVLGDILPKSQIALAGLQKALILISVILTVIGIYFVEQALPDMRRKQSDVPNETVNFAAMTRRIYLLRPLRSIPLVLFNMATGG